MWKRMLPLLWVATAGAVGAQAQEGSREGSERRLMTEAEIAASGVKVPADALERRTRSEQRLASEGVPVNRYLPAIEGESEAKRRSAQEVADRAMTLLIVAARAEGLEIERVREVIAEYRLEAALTPDERAFLAKPAVEEKDAIAFTWRYEAAGALLWALGYVEKLGKPEEPLDPALLTSILVERSREELLAGAKLRPLPQILDEADLIYRYHWAARDAQVNGKPVPPGLNYDAIMERHYALNWLIGYMDQAWDEVTTDT